MIPRPGERLDLSPAKYIWLPVERTLPGTVALFRREITLDAVPKSAAGVVFADSRYRFWVNGRRVQWGPAPFDPRSGEADPVNLLPFLQAGENVIGIEVLYYGQGDGTWPMGKPGLIAKLEIGDETIVTDASWRVALDRGHRAGRAKRSFLRALQEEFDARLHPRGWNAPGFEPDVQWRTSRELNLAPVRTPFSGWHASYQDDF